jgi:hypothetical protein
MLNGIESSLGVDTSIEPLIRSVIAWGRKREGGSQPPELTISGPVPVTDGQWVLNDIGWGAVARAPGGYRIQQRLTLTLLEFIEPTLLKSPAKRNRNR